MLFVARSAQWALKLSLSTAANQRTQPIKKLLVSAIANAKDRKNVGIDKLKGVCEIRVDKGPIVKYFKPGAQGRSMPISATSHMSIILKSND